MSLRFVALLVLAAFFLTSCTDKKTSIEQAWIFNDMPSQTQLVKDIKAYGVNIDYDFNSANFIDLQADGGFTSYMGQFEEGKWMLKDSNLLLTNSSNKVLKLRVLRLNEKEMVCGSKLKKKIWYFTALPNRFKDPAHNPFSSVNNQWRIPPAQRESDVELHRRLKNHFAFWEKYFTWGETHQLQALPVTTTPSLLKVYSNGVKLEYFEYLAPEWQQAFYDTADSRKAYNDFYYTMHARNIKWKDTENSFLRMSDAFGQMQQWMKEKEMIQAVGE